MVTNPHGRIASCRVDIPAQLKAKLFGHLFPGDGEEHAAVLGASIARDGENVRFLVRHVLLANDGADYVPGVRGYRHLRGEFVHRCIVFCRERQLAYLAVHNHPGTNRVGFSNVDLDSHERGYPALLDLMQGLPVGALVFATQAAAADIWWPSGQRTPTTEVRVIGHTIERLADEPRIVADDGGMRYDRQVMMFGSKGQALLRSARVGVIGAGGAGSLIVEYLARLGVGTLVVADPDRIEVSNLSRVVGARRFDAWWPFTAQASPAWVRRLAARLSRRKVRVLRRLAAAANPEGKFVDIAEPIEIDSVAAQFRSCDFLFLAADTASARLVFNAIVQQYYVPGIQIGAKIRADEKTGELLDVFSVMRWVLPGFGCLWCSGLISPKRLAWEAKTDHERKDQRYGTESPDPSVITMNAVAASYAVNEFLFAMLGLRARPDSSTWGYMWHFLWQRNRVDSWHPPTNCSECRDHESSRFGKGDAVVLPTVRDSLRISRAFAKPFTWVRMSWAGLNTVRTRASSRRLSLFASTAAHGR